MLNYTQLNSWVVTLLRGDPYALSVLVHLMLHRNIIKDIPREDQDITYPQSHKQIADITGMTKPTVKAKLDKLKNLLLIEPTDAPKNKHSFRIICTNEPTIIQIPKEISEPTTKTGTGKKSWENLL